MSKYRMKPNAELVETEAVRIRAELDAMTEPNSPAGTHYCIKLSHDFLMNSNSDDHYRLLSAVSRKAYLSKLKGNGFDGYYLSIHRDALKGRTRDEKAPAKRQAATNRER